MKNFISSRNKYEKCTAKEAIIKGLSKDGGLFVPENFGTEKFDIADFINLSYQEMAYKVMSLFFDDFTKDELETCIKKAYEKNFSSEDISPVSKIGKDYLLELYHGPTSAFKDIALTILPYLLKTAYKDENKKIYILTATSGDTGKAALEGFKNVEGTYITVFYPNKGVSLIQEKQMNTTVGNNVEVVSINGNFDDCQKLVKTCYEKIESSEVQLSSANSINIGRLIPQVVYYFKAYSDLVKKQEIEINEKVNFVVPTGNFGNILAGYFAKVLGCPIDKLICASNENNILTDFIKTGVYDRNREFFTTISPSMDILISSNLERLLFILSDYDDVKIAKYMESLARTGKYVIDRDLLTEIQKTFEAYYCSEEECRATIRDVFNEDKRLIDTHTAVAYAASKKIRNGNKNIILSTASPYKFCNNVLSSLKGYRKKNEFDAMRELENLSGEQAPKNLKEIENIPNLHNKNIEIKDGINIVLERIEKLK
ncbi:threonine synthase [Fusobacterium gastrosuis]|uniref:threonine synthase n=1 Tax=Fusobacterium gastrosuis TaxID=1755100 RepID=UPI002979F94F|nr:threonine synthase [Fusobacteriaceae bacterium]MDD7410636.1 threonine synthase [Fusobacteriaceae bacterium]MDY5714224.1 threonine synthase [Fusobacterium gastrosuis]